MTATVREQVIAAFVGAFDIDEDAPFEGYARERNLDHPTGNWPVLVFQDGPQVASHDFAGTVLNTMAVTVEGYLVEDTRAELGPAMNELYGQVVLAAAADHTLGGLAIDIREIGMTPEIDDEGSKYLGVVAVDFEIDYQTLENNPYALAP
jgi:hypothetical protein